MLENIMSLDLELNQPSNKIIQVGVVVGNLQTGNILDRLSVIVNPKEELNPFIIQLTGIKQEKVDCAGTLEDTYTQVVALHKKYNCFRNPITWGGGDTEALRKQLDLDTETWCFGRRWIDCKTLFLSWRISRNEPTQGGLAKSMTKVGLKFNGTKHQARDDAENTFILYHAMLKKFKE